MTLLATPTSTASLGNLDEQTFQASWPVLDSAMNFDDLILEGRRSLRAMLRGQGLVAAGSGKWRKTPTHMHWTGPVRESLRADERQRPPASLPAEPLLTFAQQRGVPTGTGDKVLERARRTGQVTRRVADKFCCGVLHVHPCSVWGEAWWAA
jgi:hypothetical protein